MTETKNLPEKPNDPIYELLARNKMAIQNVLPKHLTAERILRLAYTAIQRSPKLRECTPASITNSVLELSMLGLEMGRTGHIVPFGKEAVFIPDYKGYIDLAHRSDRIESFPFKPVYANDEFDYQEGTTRYIKHVPCKTGNRGALIAAYAICFFKHGGFDFEVVWRPDIDATKKASPGAKYSDSPWNKPDQEWTMWCKTAVRRLAKRIPQSPELQKASYHEEMAEAGLKQDIHYLDDPIDVDVSKSEDLKDKIKNGKEGAAKDLYGKKPDEEDNKKESTEAYTDLAFTEEFRLLRKSGLEDYVVKNIDRLAAASDNVKATWEKKWHTVLGTDFSWPVVDPEEKGPLQRQNDDEDWNGLKECPKMNGNNIPKMNCKDCEDRPGCPSWGGGVTGGETLE